jgi:hypothetical protein
MSLFGGKSIDPDRLVEKLTELSKSHTAKAGGANMSANLVEAIVGQVLTELALAVLASTR